MEDSDFQYVVEKKPPAPISFGSKLPRNTDLIGKGLSPFQKRLAPEFFPNTGPGTYDTQKYRTVMEKTSRKGGTKKGAGPLASSEPRFRDKMYMRTPSPTRYSLANIWVRQGSGKAPFGSTTKRLHSPRNKLPGPGTYNIASKKCQRTRFMSNLGYPTMIPSIEIICVSRPTDTCIKCNQVCAGDYWHKDHITYLCHLCWEEEKRGGELYNLKELKTFEKIRNCHFAHDHDGTTAALRLLPPRKINKKLRLENYLNLYIKC